MLQSFRKIRKEHDVSFIVSWVKNTGLSIDLLTVVNKLYFDFFKVCFLVMEVPLETAQDYV